MRKVDVNVVSFSAFNSVTVAEIMKLIQEAPNKQSRLNLIPTWLLKECIDVLSPFLASLCNTSLQTDVVPAQFKTAVITPRLKKPGMDINTAQSYRPISNQSFLSKLLERVVGGQIQSFIDVHSLLPHCQSAYRHGFSTETALVTVYSDLTTALDSNADSLAVLTLLDMTAACDTVDHSILMQCLQRSYGISGNSLAGFTSYLAARKQSVRFRDKQSLSRHILHMIQSISLTKHIKI